MASETSEASDSEALKPQTSSTTPTTVMASGNTMDRFMSVGQLAQAAYRPEELEEPARRLAGECVTLLRNGV